MASSLKERFRNELNPAQFEAVFHDEGPLLVIAGAGSGKTRTLTYRAARLVEEGRAPESILLLTFTRKAAGEMLRRASILLDGRCRQIAGGTFHSFANSMLKRYAFALGYPNGFTIIDRPDAESLIGFIVKETITRPKFGAFPRKRTLADIFSKIANKDTELEEILDSEYPHFLPYRDILQDICNGYTEVKKQQALMDYDDLLNYLWILLDQHLEVRAQITGRFRHVMVDEYQDTNRVQARIVRLLAGEHHNVMVVGDDSQSIYSFRGADFRNIMEFPAIFPNTRVITLEENYRSAEPILALTNQLIDQAIEKYPKTLFSKRGGRNPPQLVFTGSENSQSRFIIDKAQELTRRGIPLKDIAVLFRAGFHAFDLEVELTREGIPFVKYGGFKFMESAHIKDILAYLRVLSNPYDRLNWFRILLLVDKIGPKSAQTLYDRIRRQASGLNGFLTNDSKLATKPGIQRLKEVLAAAADASLSPVRRGEQILAYYLPILKQRHDDHPKRARDLEQLLAIMETYDNLDRFLEDMTLEPPTTTVSGAFDPTDSHDDLLVLSTVHSAKGLEWHTVFILWALDGRFPSLMAADNDAQLDEELRLMYVASTRAREQLYFMCPGQVYDRMSGMLLSQPSRFLADLPETILERLSGALW
ncbi:MAG: ATP-dependent helicase [Desulfobacterales bacterium]|jgi:DNA helicase-2/ATP-dependent DNA helicase PcrA